MYARAGRLGLIVLESDQVLEPEMRRALPEDVDYHVARVRYTGVHDAGLAAATRGVAGAIRTLLPVHPDVIVWACTSASFYRGRRGHEILLKRLALLARGVPTLTASAAVVRTLHRLRAVRLGVVAPYPPEINARLTTFLQEEGFVVERLLGLYDSAVDDDTLQRTPGPRLREAIETAARDVDAVLVSCTGLVTLPLLDAVTEAVGRPVVSSNAAILAEALAVLPSPGPVRGFHALLRALALPAA
ncbi:MAG: aspartate/glutamate racemase family protein [Armatimonadota bacterium]|nr:aspartate/glutamate racemase family protein [Armatimonadota bacterium]MDR7449510.1 aspartate/glutamate racemase family protein [Armatimonadota bacterium]MDR7460529.1 aspartate/glutamate racemase family protein [Armatimonadota bacterium]MDR7479722.1 aspartate/glutamate racemase family protein [Armatimonadota bacterium]MDR7489123.1 aspartate/glutamate racemase family protein [Armatimonadota bacterium]